MPVSRETPGVASYKISVTPTFGLWATVEVTRKLNGRKDVIGTARVRRPLADNGESAGRAIVLADQQRRKRERVSLVKATQPVSLVKPGKRPAISLRKTQAST